MMKTLRGGALAAAIVVAAGAEASAQPPTAPVGPTARPPAAVGGQLPRSLPWWKSQSFRKELGLTTDQAARIDKIWETTRPELKQEWDELSRCEDKLSKLIQSDADEAVLSRQIDRVETARATANKTRSVMLVQMLKTLTPEQRTRFYALHERSRDAYRPPPAGEPRTRPEN